MKEINFKYYGGIEVVHMNYTSGDITVSQDKPCEWLEYSLSPFSIELKVQKNIEGVERSCELVLKNNKNTESIIVKQEGYQNLTVDLSTLVVIPEYYYNQNKNYDLQFRVYGGSKDFITDDTLNDKIEKIFSSDLFNDYVLHIDAKTEGAFVFKHADNEDEVKVITIKKINGETKNGYVVFNFHSMEYINSLPPTIIINNNTSTVLTIVYNCFFDNDLNFIEDSDFIVEVSAPWVNMKYKDKKIYLKAESVSSLSDRKCLLTIRNKQNTQQSFSTVLKQKRTIKG